MPNNRYTVELIAPIIKECTSWAQVCRKLNVVPATGAQSHITKRAKQLGLDSSHFKGQGWNKGSRLGPTFPLSHYLVKDSYTKSAWIKNRLLKEKIKENKCEICGRTEWEGFTIPTELHHINSDHLDNRLENLQILCPNCHYIEHRKLATVEKLADSAHLECAAILKKHTGSSPVGGTTLCLDCKKRISKKSKRCKSCATKLWSKPKIVWPSKEELLKQLETKPCITLAKELGVSDNAIKKHLKTTPINNNNSALRTYRDMPMQPI